MADPTTMPMTSPADAYRAALMAQMNGAGQSPRGGAIDYVPPAIPTYVPPPPSAADVARSLAAASAVRGAYGMPAAMPPVAVAPAGPATAAATAAAPPARPDYANWPAPAAPKALPTVTYGGMPAAAPLVSDAEYRANPAARTREAQANQAYLAAARAAAPQAGGGMPAVRAPVLLDPRQYKSGEEFAQAAIAAGMTNADLRDMWTMQHYLDPRQQAAQAYLGYGLRQARQAADAEAGLRSAGATAAQIAAADADRKRAAMEFDRRLGVIGGGIPPILGYQPEQQQ